MKVEIVENLFDQSVAHILLTVFLIYRILIKSYNLFIYII